MAKVPISKHVCNVGFTEDQDKDKEKDKDSQDH